MKKYIIIIFSVFVSIFCFSQNNKCSKMEIQINFYPSSGGNAIYAITLIGNNLEIKDLNSSKNKGKAFNKVLSKGESDKVKQVVSKIKQRADVETDVILDSWRVELLINGSRYYNESGIKIETLPEDIKNLYELLIKKSKVKIELYSFS